MSKESKIGIMVIVVIGLTVWGYLFLKGQDIFQNSLAVETNFTNVDELAVSSPVLINGVKVGNVTDIILDPVDISTVRVKFNIEGVSHVPKTATAVLKTKGIMGGKVLDVVFSNPCTGNGDCLEDGDVLKSNSVGLLTTMLGSDVTSYMDSIKNKVTDLTKSEDGEEIDFAELLFDLKATIENLNTITTQASNIISSSSYNVNNISNNLDAFSRNLESNNERITNIVTNLETVSKDLKDANIDQTLASANSAMIKTEDAVGDIKNAVVNANTAIGRINNVVDKVERGEGSLGLLVNDKELYNKLSTSSREINLLLQDIRLNPKRYVNVSIFGKKQKEYVVPEDDPARVEPLEQN